MSRSESGSVKVGFCVTVGNLRLEFSLSWISGSRIAGTLRAEMIVWELGVGRVGRPEEPFPWKPRHILDQELSTPAPDTWDTRAQSPISRPNNFYGGASLPETQRTNSGAYTTVKVARVVVSRGWKKRKLSTLHSVKESLLTSYAEETELRESFQTTETPTPSIEIFCSDPPPPTTAAAHNPHSTFTHGGPSSDTQIQPLPSASSAQYFKFPVTRSVRLTSKPLSGVCGWLVIIRLVWLSDTFLIPSKHKMQSVDESEVKANFHLSNSQSTPVRQLECGSENRKV